MSETRKVRVTNIPIRAYADALVPIPKDTRPEDVQSAIVKVLSESPDVVNIGEPGLPEIEGRHVLERWEFDIVDPAIS